MRTPVAFLIFNRPERTEQVFATIARARPKILLVIADGPRRDHPGDAEKCAATRAIIDRVDWPCDILRNYAEENLGCAIRPATGLRWVFEQVEEAIVLEDDCLPHSSFFVFCEELLERYREDERVMHISGDQFLTLPRETSLSYSFSHYCLSWGWATWRRAFRHYDPDIKLWPALRQTSWIAELLSDENAAAHWARIFDEAHIAASRSGYHTWDFQWLFACWAQRGLSILPVTNLVSNIGFGEDATHTKRTGDKLAHLPTVPMAFPLRHPPFMKRDRELDRMIFEQLVPSPGERSFAHQLRRKCAAALPEPVRRSMASMRSKLLQAVR